MFSKYTADVFAVIKVMTEPFVNNVALIFQVKNQAKTSQCLEALVLARHVTASLQKGELEKTTLLRLLRRLTKYISRTSTPK